MKTRILHKIKTFRALLLSNRTGLLFGILWSQAILSSFLWVINLRVIAEKLNAAGIDLLSNNGIFWGGLIFITLLVAIGEVCLNSFNPLNNEPV